VAAYQAGRLLNQLNWHCQLAVLISREEHRHAIDVVVAKLKSASQEIVQDAPSRAEKQIDRFLSRFWRDVSSEWAMEYREGLADELRCSEQEAQCSPDMTCESACVYLNDMFVDPIVEKWRRKLKRNLESSDRWAFALGEYVDRGVRRSDVYAFVNRYPPDAIEQDESSHDDVQSESHLDNEGDTPYYCETERETEGEQKPPQSNDAQKPAFAVGSVGSEDRTREDKSDDDQPPFDGYVNRRFANYHPVPGSILPEPAWDQQVVELSRRVGIDKALSTVISPVHLGATCENIVEAVESVDSLLYSALCKIKKQSVRKKQTWWHAPEDPVPPEYPFGSLRGQKKDLAKWIVLGDPRTLDAKVKKGVYWGRAHERDEFEVFFKTKEQFEGALKQKNKSPREADVHSNDPTENATPNG